MTEEKWLSCTDPFPMLDYLWKSFTDRKRLLFVVACWRDAWSLIPDTSSRQAVKMLEQFAESKMVGDTEVIFKQFEIEQGLWERVWHPDRGGFQSQPPWDEVTAAIAATILVTGATTEASQDAGRAETEAERAAAHAESIGLLSEVDPIV